MCYSEWPLADLRCGIGTLYVVVIMMYLISMAHLSLLIIGSLICAAMQPPHLTRRASLNGRGNYYYYYYS